jgi:hypothetical protein
MAMRMGRMGITITSALNAGAPLSSTGFDLLEYARRKTATD